MKDYSNKIFSTWALGYVLLRSACWICILIVVKAIEYVCSWEEFSSIALETMGYALLIIGVFVGKVLILSKNHYEIQDGYLVMREYEWLGRTLDMTLDMSQIKSVAIKRPRFRWPLMSVLVISANGQELPLYVTTYRKELCDAIQAFMKNNKI